MLHRAASVWFRIIIKFWDSIPKLQGTAVGAIFELQEIPERSVIEVSMVRAGRLFTGQELIPQVPFRSAWRLWMIQVEEVTDQRDSKEYAKLLHCITLQIRLEESSPSS